MLLLASVRYKPPLASKADTFPFKVPILQALTELEFPSAVTFFVGENGSGKSTLLEGIAAAANLPAVGSENVDGDATLIAARALGKRLTLSWSRRTHNGFFMRSEDFFGFAQRMARIRRELEQDLREVEQEYAGRSALAQSQARMAYVKEIGAIKQRYGEGLDARSHGESYFTLFQSRLVPNGLYLMDEPEAPLSPMRQLTLISLIKTMVAEQNAQFIIATHSPMLMALPGATIYNFDGSTISPVAYDDVDHVTLTRAFMRDPQQFLRHL
jgi:predicted ATPase